MPSPDLGWSGPVQISAELSVTCQMPLKQSLSLSLPVVPLQSLFGIEKEASC